MIFVKASNKSKIEFIYLLNSNQLLNGTLCTLNVRKNLIFSLKIEKIQKSYGSEWERKSEKLLCNINVYNKQ
jgi:hypothetical protein